MWRRECRGYLSSSNTSPLPDLVNECLQEGAKQSSTSTHTAVLHMYRLYTHACTHTCSSITHVFKWEMRRKKERSKQGQHVHAHTHACTYTRSSITHVQIVHARTHAAVLHMYRLYTHAHTQQYYTCTDCTHTHAAVLHMYRLYTHARMHARTHAAVLHMYRLYTHARTHACAYTRSSITHACMRTH